MTAGLHAPAARSVGAWDLPTRLFKWLFALLVVLAWVSNKYGGAVPFWHVWNGYALLILIVFRLLWGVFGGATARFSAFVASPVKAFNYLRGLFRNAPRQRYLGHNPLGGWMVLTLLIVVAAQACLGLYSADEDRLIIEGPLAKTVSDATVDAAAHWHRIGFNVILFLASLHVAANLAYDFCGRAGLIRAMLTGRKPGADYQDLPENVPASMGRAAACLAAAIVIVFGGIVMLGGKPF